MPLSDVMGSQGPQDPGPKKRKMGQSYFTWDQMRLWNKYRDESKGSDEEVFNKMQKENPDATKSMTFSDLKDAFDIQSYREWKKQDDQYQQDKASGKYDDKNSIEYKRMKEMKWEDWGGPQYRTINKFLPVTYDDGKTSIDMGLSDEWGNIENPKKVNITGRKAGPVDHMVSKQLPSDIKIDDLTESLKYPGFAEFADPQTGDLMYIDINKPLNQFGVDFRNKITKDRDAREAAWWAEMEEKKKKAEERRNAGLIK